MQTSLLLVRVAPVTVALVLVLMVGLAEIVIGLVLWRREHEIAIERRDVADERVHVLKLVDDFSRRVKLFSTSVRPDPGDELRAEVKDLQGRVRALEVRKIGGQGGAGGQGGPGGGTGGAGGAEGKPGEPGAPGENPEAAVRE